MAKICFVGLKGTSHGDVSFTHTENTIWRKGMAYWLCSGVFLADLCFECSGGTSHRGVSFEHTEQAFWWEIMNVFANTKNMFWVFRWVSRRNVSLEHTEHGTFL